MRCAILEGVMLAVLNVEDVWQPDHSAEAKEVFFGTSKAHPGADYAINKANPWYVGGTLEGLQARRTMTFVPCA